MEDFKMEKLIVLYFTKNFLLKVEQTVLYSGNLSYRNYQYARA